MEINTDFFCNRWQLTNLHILSMSACTGNYVAKAFSAHYKTNVVLKIATNPTVFIQEQKALIYFNGNGCVKLLDYDLEKLGLLLEYIKPGTQLKNLFLVIKLRQTQLLLTLSKNYINSQSLQQQRPNLKR